MPNNTPFLRLFVFALCSVLLCLQMPAQAEMPTIQLSSGIHLLKTEVAADAASREKGLMYRKNLPPQQGMLFLFEGMHVQCMWMRNTFIPLSVAFLEDDGTIINIEHMQPHTETSHCSAKPSRYALETNKGWFERRGIKPGMKISGLPQISR